MSAIPLLKLKPFGFETKKCGKGQIFWCPHENDWPVTPPTLLK